MTVKEAIIVEGKYDKQRVSMYVDALIVETRGFGIFKDKEKRSYLKKLALERGIIILTDSDSAGFLIRNHLKTFIPEEYIKNAYIKRVEGKEKRKEKPSKEGFLGVEGHGKEEIIQALERAGAGSCAKAEPVFTAADLYNLGITGGENSREKRLLLTQRLELPPHISSKELLKYMNLNSEAARNALNITES